MSVCAVLNDCVWACIWFSGQLCTLNLCADLLFNIDMTVLCELCGCQLGIFGQALSMPAQGVRHVTLTLLILP